MPKELSEKEKRELEELYGHNREENQVNRAFQSDRDKFYRWGALFFQIMTILMIICFVILAVDKVIGFMALATK